MKRQTDTQQLRKDYTASGLILNKEMNKILLIFHNKLQKWMQPGGHCEPNESPEETVIREVQEELGIKTSIVSNNVEKLILSENEWAVPSPYCILHEIIPASSKDVEHLHVDFFYILEAEETEISLEDGKILDAKWFTLTEVLSANTFESIKKISAQLLKE